MAAGKHDEAKYKLDVQFGSGVALKLKSSMTNEDQHFNVQPMLRLINTFTTDSTEKNLKRLTGFIESGGYGTVLKTRDSPDPVVRELAEAVAKEIYITTLCHRTLNHFCDQQWREYIISRPSMHPQTAMSGLGTALGGATSASPGT